MALSDKDILITPNKGQSADPKIEFKGADASLGPQTITLNVYPTNNGTISLEGSAGQLFSVTNSLTGTIWSVNDVSGIPSIEVIDTGLIKIAQYSGNVLIGTGTDNGSSKLQVNGTAQATDFNSVSDEREKTNITTIENALNKILSLRGVEFDWKATGEHAVGVIAQEVLKVVPYAVNGGGKVLTVSYGSLVGILIEAIKEQQRQIEKLQIEVSKLK